MKRKNKVQGVTVQLVSKSNGQAVERQWFKRLQDVSTWLNNCYPNWRDDYDLEMFSD